MLETVPLSEAVQRINESQTLAIDAKAKAMKAKGEDVVGLVAGEPDFDTPDFIKEAAIQAIKDGKTKYTPASGLPQLRAAICKKLETENHLKYEPAQVIVSCGAKHSIFNIIVSTLNAGDEVLIPSPYWVSYPEMVQYVGAKPIVVPTGNALKANPELLSKYKTSKTKLLILNSPSNPTGVVYQKSELEAIGQWCLENNVWIISDEIYEKLWYADEPFCSIASLDPEIQKISFVVNGVSKAYSMTGWRIGYVACDLEIAKAMGRLQSQSTSNPTSIAQWAAIAAIEGDQSVVETMRQTYIRRRKLVLDLLRQIPGTSCVEPGGAFYVFPSFKNGQMNSFEFCEKLLQEQKVATVPGAAFGQEGYLRISYATSDEIITEGIHRISQFLNS